MTICDHFLRQVELAPESIAVHQNGVDYSYRELEAASAGIARWLQSMHVGPGERVLLVLRNSPEYVAAYLGILRAGCVVVALNHQITAQEFKSIAIDCQPAVLIVEPGRLKELGRVAITAPSLKQVMSFADANMLKVCQNAEGRNLEPPADPAVVHDDSVAQIIYTSGTTGRPKGVMLTHANLAANCKSIISYLKLTSTDSVLVVLPFFYSYGNSLLFTHLACGGRLVLAADSVFWSRTTALMVEQRVTGLAGVPSTYAMLLHKSDFPQLQFPSLRYLTCAGGRLAPAHVETVQNVVPHAELYLMYGQTEATARLSTLYPDDLPIRAGSIGKGIPGVTLSVLADDGQPTSAGDVGEIVANGPNVMAGYWNDRALTETVLRPTGLHTGDLGYRDADGYIFIVGRKDDMIKSGGHRIFPAEIEDVLSRDPHVAEIAVVGVPDTLLYERPVAVVVPAPSASEIDGASILARCVQQLPPHKRPREVVFVDALPKTSSGKVQRSAVKMMICSVLENSAG